MTLLSTVNRKKYVQQQRDYHAGIVAELNAQRRKKQQRGMNRVIWLRLRTFGFDG
jgi:hypothetical protein